MPDTFFRLGPEWVLRAVEAAGLRPSGYVTPLTCLENRVHDVHLEDGSHVVVKFYRPGRWSRAAILEEHAFLLALRDAEVPVCAPLVFSEPGEKRGRGGQPAPGRTLHEADGIFYAVWPRVGGRSPSELDDADVALLGRLLARIHVVGERLRPKHRPTLSGDSYVREPLALLERGGFVPSSCARRYREAALALADGYDQASRGTKLQAIHGDCHFGNLLHGPTSEGNEGWFFLDFDDFVIGPAVQDVWMLLPGRDDEAERQRSLLVDAYEQMRPFDRASLALVERLRGLRFVRYAGWIARRWEDPAFPAAFPHFGTEEYWEDETRDLEQQIELIEHGSVDAARAGVGRGPRDGSSDVDLTNKDFFWDL